MYGSRSPLPLMAGSPGHPSLNTIHLSLFFFFWPRALKLGCITNVDMLFTKTSLRGSHVSNRSIFHLKFTLSLKSITLVPRVPFQSLGNLSSQGMLGDCSSYFSPEVALEVCVKKRVEKGRG